VTDPAPIVSALALAVASGFGTQAGKALWGHVKGIVKRKRPDGAAILDYFEKSPEQMIEPIRRLLQDVHAVEDQKIVELVEAVLRDAKPSQTATGQFVAQTIGDIGTLFQAEQISIIEGDARGIDLDDIQAVRGPDHRYSDYWTMWQATGGEDQFLGVVAQFDVQPGLFNSTKSGLVAAGAIYFARDVSPEYDEDYVAVTAPKQGDQPQVVARFHADGVVAIEVLQRFDPAVPWGWLLLESYRALRYLLSTQVITVYPGATTARVALTLSNWPENGVTVLGPHAYLRANGPATGGQSLKRRMARHEDTIRVGEDPWRVALRFVERALSRSGYTGHEADLDGMDRDQFLNLHLLPHEPLYQLLGGPISKA